MNKKTRNPILVILILTAIMLMLSACNPSVNPEDIVNTYDISVLYNDETQSLSGAMLFTYINPNEEELEKMVFNLYPNAYREGAVRSPIAEEYVNAAYSKGISYGDITVSSVKSGEVELAYEINGVDKNLLSVTLDEPLINGKSVTIEIVFSVRLANIRHRLGYTDKTVNLSNFYPILAYIENGAFCEYPYSALGDPFISECANYIVTFVCPSDYIVAHSGEKTTAPVTNEDGSVTYKLKGTATRDFALALSKKYTVLSSIVNGISINYYYYNDTMPDSTLEMINRAMITYNELFGKYPYANYSVAETDFCYGGMEYPQLTFISAGLVREQFVHTVLHETAHQWWYCAVGNNQVTSAWMDEGLSEYSVMLFYKENPEYGDYDSKLKGAYKAYKLFYDVIKDYNKSFDTSLDRSIDEFENYNTYMHLNYNKAMLMFDSLKSTMGERAFFQALKKYYSVYTYDIATKDDMINCFDTYFGSALSTWFDKWLGNDIVIG